MSDYPGNPALAAPIKERVNSTFQQALSLYRAGRTDEVISGCTLILQMDPLFDPAKRLLEKARNPASPIDIESMMPSSPADPAAALKEAREAMNARDFQRVVQITTDVLTNDLMNDEARVLSEEARNKMEAAPFVAQFMKKCEQHLTAGNLAAAQGDLEKARSLDADHPSVKRMQEMISASGLAKPAAATPPPPTPPAAQPGAPAAFSFDSFVVDAPPATGRGTAQASDFGFTFEEEKPAAPAPPPAAQQGSGFGSGFSFDAPSTSPFSTSGPIPSPIPQGFSFDGPAKQPASGDFDFSTASIETSPADQQKIEQYLAEGDRAFDSGKYQDAIDLWSRVFLIDVTNEQASERIERAKSRRREGEQKVDATISAGVQALERKDMDTARARFEEALRLDPSNQSAKDYLDKLSPRSSGAGAAIPPPPMDEKFDIFADDALPSSDEPPGGYEEPAPITAIPTPKRAAAASPAKTQAKPSRQAPIGPIAIVVGLLVLAAAGWFGWSKFMSAPKVDPAATQATFSQATQLAQAGKYDQAIAVLQDIKPDDPQHDRALVMIGELQHKKTQAAEMVEGRPASAFYQEQIAAGRSAFESHDYDRAKKAFEQALRVRALPADARKMYDTAALQAAKLDSAKALFNERKYQDAISNLQPLLQQDPQNQSIRRMILDAHFNLGATALQEERLPDALREFDEVLKTDPADELAKKSRELAVRYNGQQKDLLYKIYVKYLPLRQAS